MESVPSSAVSSDMSPKKTAGQALGRLINELDYKLPESVDNRNRYDTTMNAIKAYILQQHLVPGDPLPTETELCDALQSSRSSVREAVRKLEALHIVSVQHGRGMFVGDLSLDPLVETLSFKAMIPQNNDFAELRSVVELRHYLDLGCAQKVVSEMTGTQQPELERITDEMAKLARGGKTFLTEDITFHMRMMEMLHNDVAEQLFQSLWLVHMAVIPKLGLQVSDSLNETAVAHKSLLESAMAGDIEGYRSATEAHYKPIEAILAQRLGQD